MSVTGTNCVTGGPINSGNVNWEPCNDCRISSSNRTIEDMSTEELERYERILARAIGGPTTDEERQRRRRQYQAEKTGEICGKCGQDLLPGEKVYRTELKWMTVLCEGCAPKYMKRDYDPYGLRSYLTEPCDTCSRLVVFEATGRDHYRRHVFCCERCRWTYYNTARNERAAQAREKACEVCGESFTATRTDARTCSPACKQKAYRQRKKEAA